MYPDFGSDTNTNLNSNQCRYMSQKATDGRGCRDLKHDDVDDEVCDPELTVCIRVTWLDKIRAPLPAESTHEAHIGLSGSCCLPCSSPPAPNYEVVNSKVLVSYL